MATTSTYYILIGHVGIELLDVSGCCCFCFCCCCSSSCSNICLLGPVNACVDGCVVRSWTISTHYKARAWRGLWHGFDCPPASEGRADIAKVPGGEGGVMLGEQLQAEWVLRWGWTDGWRHLSLQNCCESGVWKTKSAGRQTSACGLRCKQPPRSCLLWISCLVRCEKVLADVFTSSTSQRKKANVLYLPVTVVEIRRKNCKTLCSEGMRGVWSGTMSLKAICHMWQSHLHSFGLKRGHLKGYSTANTASNAILCPHSCKRYTFCNDVLRTSKWPTNQPTN